MRTQEQHSGEATLASDGRRKTDHVQFLENQNGWPNWPLQTVKRQVPSSNRSYPYEVGVVVAAEATVYLCNLYRFKPSELASYNRHEYSGFAAMVDDGWVVD